MHRGVGNDNQHIFTYDGRDILYQVDTGAFFEIDELVKNILILPNHNRQAILSELSAKYEIEDLVGVIEELEAHDLLSSGPPLPSQDVPQVFSRRESNAPLDITLHVAHGCNISCTYCFALGGHYGEKPTVMDFRTAKASIDWLLRESKNAGKCNVTFFGGEPLLNFDLIKKVVPYAKSEANARNIDITFSITTNGTLLSGQALAFMMKEEISIMLSLDGDAQTHNSVRTFHDGTETYDVIAENARAAAEQNPGKVIIRATMTAKNLDIEGISEHISQFGTDIVEVAPTIEHPKSPTAIREEHLPELKKHLKKISLKELSSLKAGETDKQPQFASKIKQLLAPRKKEYGCGGGSTYFGVSADGSIYFCSAFASMTEYKMGDVFNGLDPEKQARFDHDLHIDNREVCKTCWARYLCGGSCAYDAQMVNGKPEEPNPVTCERIRYSYELAMGMALELQEQNPAVFDELCAP